MDLLDLGFKDPPFTWNNNRKGIHNIRERLDRVLITYDWFNLFPKASITHIPVCMSDHLALVLDLRGPNVRPKRPFRFQTMWCMSPNCETWLEELGMFSLQVLLLLNTKERQIFLEWN